MPIKDAPSEQSYDVRTAKWYIRRGQIDPTEYERFLRSLPDAADKAEQIQATQPGTESRKPQDRG